MVSALVRPTAGDWGHVPAARARRREHGVVALREVRLEHDAPTEGHSFCLPAVRALPLRPADKVTVLIGENGSGKSTLIEAIAVAAGFNPSERFLHHLG